MYLLDSRLSKALLYRPCDSGLVSSDTPLRPCDSVLLSSDTSSQFPSPLRPHDSVLLSIVIVLVPRSALLASISDLTISAALAPTLRLYEPAPSPSLLNQQAQPSSSTRGYFYEPPLCKGVRDYHQVQRVVEWVPGRSAGRVNFEPKNLWVSHPYTLILIRSLAWPFMEGARSLVRTSTWVIKPTEAGQTMRGQHHHRQPISSHLRFSAVSKWEISSD